MLLDVNAVPIVFQTGSSRDPHITKIWSQQKGVLWRWAAFLKREEIQDNCHVKKDLKKIINHCVRRLFATFPFIYITGLHRRKELNSNRYSFKCSRDTMVNLANYLNCVVFLQNICINKTTYNDGRQTEQCVSIWFDDAIMLIYLFSCLILY